MPYDKSAALLLWGALGLLVVLVLETIACMAVLGQDVIDAAYGSAKTLVTVDPNDEVADGPKGLKAFLTASMLVTLLLEASFTAGLVNRLVNRRLTGLVGRRAVPRRQPRRGGRARPGRPAALRSAAAAGSAWWRSTTTTTARTSASRVSSASRW